MNEEQNMEDKTITTNFPMSVECTRCKHCGHLIVFPRGKQIYYCDESCRQKTKPLDNRTN